MPESTITQWESVRGCVNITTVGASVKSVGASLETDWAAVETDGAEFGAEAEPVGVTVKHCNEFKRYDPGLHICS